MTSHHKDQRLLVEPPELGDDPWDKIVELIHAVNNLGRAVEQMAFWLVQAQTGFNHKDAEGVVKILRGETTP